VLPCFGGAFFRSFVMLDANPFPARTPSCSDQFDAPTETH
jgi:hypothetical protein